MSDDDLSREEHHQRGRDDARTSNKFGQAAAQSAILINGGAATALLAFLSQVISKGDAIKFVIPWVMGSLFLYGAGVFFAALSLPSASAAIENYMLGHDRLPGARQDDAWTAADERWNEFMWRIRASLWTFAASTTLLALGLFLSFAR